ncbi:hypothetical protein HIM_04759 [Hirsutella minnesotensis 3608]|uniref:Uncharacterized protein n=1 Tax=Hirsutella minnesotensis 3608 TaxID=1043627 RepID=A0A0F7ZPR0_9HYPO|nr:hypothetical protein HIM_04759 [Hirsutella minnesotensis 3608]
MHARGMGHDRPAGRREQPGSSTGASAGLESFSKPVTRAAWSAPSSLPQWQSVDSGLAPCPSTHVGLRTSPWSMMPQELPMNPPPFSPALPESLPPRGMRSQRRIPCISLHIKFRMHTRDFGKKQPRPPVVLPVHAPKSAGSDGLTAEMSGTSQGARLPLATTKS